VIGRRAGLRCGGLRRLREALASINAQHAAARGVVHAAMVIEDALLRDMDPVSCTACSRRRCWAP
jgi:hypothetical protein